MTDEELLAAILKARRAAHDAPLNPYRRDINGHRWVEPRSTAWADRSKELLVLFEEARCRGLKQPEPDWDGDSRR